MIRLIDLYYLDTKLGDRNQDVYINQLKSLINIYTAITIFLNRRMSKIKIILESFDEVKKYQSKKNIILSKAVFVFTGSTNNG